MRKILIMAVLSLCFCNGLVFADNSAQKISIYYVCSSGAESGGIIGAIEKLDTWIRNNLW